MRSKAYFDNHRKNKFIYQKSKLFEIKGIKKKSSFLNSVSLSIEQLRFLKLNFKHRDYVHP